MSDQIWYIIISIFGLLVVGIIRLFFMKSLVRAFDSFKSSYQSHRDFKGGTIVYSQFNILASVLYFLSLGFMLYKFNEYFGFVTRWDNFTTFIIIVAGLILFVYSKILLYLGFGFLIDGYKVTKEFVYNWVAINHISGFVFFPIAISLAFVDIKLLSVFIWAGIVFLIFFNIYRLVRGIKIISKENFPVYYILLYLCTLEFLPIAVLWHVLGE